MSNTINGRTPEEIKRGLECFECDDCAYGRKNNGGQARCSDVENDALAYIQRLEAGIDSIYENVDIFRGLPEKIQQLERERDAAVKRLKDFSCNTCKYEAVAVNAEPCQTCFNSNKWEFDGVQEVE